MCITISLNKLFKNGINVVYRAHDVYSEDCQYDCNKSDSQQKFKLLEL